MCSKAGS